MFKVNLPTETAKNLLKLLGDGSHDFLGFTINVETGILTDNFGNSAWRELGVRLIPAMLQHYTLGKQVPLAGNLVKFRDLPGGYAYEVAFTNRAIKPVEEAFGKEPDLLIEAAKLLGGEELKLGDAAAEIVALKGIPLTYILYGVEEYPASASIFYDESASCYLPTEDLAVLGEIITIRLIEAKQHLK